jgi:hypothetical protein
MTYYKLLQKYVGSDGYYESPSGCYFTTLEHLGKWYTGGDSIGCYRPGNGTIKCGTKVSGPSFSLISIRPLREFLDTLDPATVRMLVIQHPHILHHVNRQTEDLCLAAVRRNGYVLCFVQHQTEAICLAAVENDPTALFSVRNRTPAVCSAAVKFFCP